MPAVQVKLTLLASVLLLLMACLDPIEFSFVDQDQLLIIEGQFTPSSEKHYVRISTTTQFGLKVFQGVSNAKVYLRSEDFSEPYIEEETGIYAMEGDIISGVPGSAYYIEVELAGGERYQSVEELMPRPQKADSTYYLFEKEIFVQSNGIDRLAPILNVYVDTDLDGADLYLRWYVDELYSFPEESCGGLDIPFTCYVPLAGNAQNISLFNNQSVGLDRIVGLKVGNKTSFPEIEFKGPHYFSVYQHSITPAAFAYWQKVVDVASQSGTVFDKPPARIRGNIFNVDDPGERVLGYFELAVTDTVRTRVLPYEYQDALFRGPYCSGFARSRWGPECCNCLIIKDATTERPAWLN